ncbi:hypothetical protein [Nostoc sp.]
MALPGDAMALPADAMALPADAMALRLKGLPNKKIFNYFLWGGQHARNTKYVSGEKPHLS